MTGREIVEQLTKDIMSGAYSEGGKLPSEAKLTEHFGVSRMTLRGALEQLRQQGLFPLPDKNYSQKYVWFRRMSSTAFGRLMLLRTLPLLKRER
jgi:DNA-binding transcriptional MocR family regulator